MSRFSRRLLPVLTVGALLSGAAVAPAASAAPGTHLSAHLAALGHPTAGTPATFSLGSTAASRFTLSFGDHTRTVTGRRGPATRVRHTFARSGWYTVTLTVTGAHDRTVTSKQKVLVLTLAVTSGTTVTGVRPGTQQAAQPAAQPHTGGATVSGFAPTSGPVGRAVVITGTGFTSPATVSFNGVSTSATVNSATQLTAFVPHGNIAVTGSPGAGTGPLVVNSNASSINAGTFTVTPGLLLSASVGPPTSALALVGSGFGAYETVDLYAGTTSIGTATADVNGSLTQAGLAIPASAQPGALEIEAVGRHTGISVEAPYTVRTDWTSTGFTAAGRGYNPYENTITDFNVSTLHKSFSVPSTTALDTGVVVAGGIAYFGDDSGNLYAVNATTGAQVWRDNVGYQIVDTPTVANGVVYSGDSNGTLHGVSAANGAVVMPSFTGPTNGFASSPTVANGVAYIGNEDGNVYAVNTSTGHQVWAYNTSSPVIGTPSVVNGVVYVTCLNGALYALDGVAGTRNWSIAVGTQGNGGQLPVDNGVIYDTSDSSDGTEGVEAVDARNGGVLWSATVNSATSAAAVANGIVYVGAEDQLYALDAYSGATEWTLTSKQYVNTPSVANGIVYVGDGIGRVIGIDATSGYELWYAETGIEALGQPVIVNGEVYATGLSGVSAYTLAANYSSTS